MANYATNLFYLSTKNENDLDRVERFLNDNFQCCDLIREQGWIEAQFDSRWVYPEKEMDQLLSSLEQLSELYIRVLTHELCNEYVSFRVFSDGEWDVRY